MDNGRDIMRKKLAIFLVSGLFVSLLFCCGYGFYMQEMDNMQIVLRISGRGGYRSLRLYQGISAYHIAGIRVPR